MLFQLNLVSVCSRKLHINVLWCMVELGQKARIINFFEETWQEGGGMGWRKPSLNECPNIA